jgi:hypothetical protein
VTQAFDPGTVTRPRRVVTAAMLMKDGTVVSGVRHFSPDMRDVLFKIYGKCYHRLVQEQGFICNHYKFVDRGEGYLIALESGQITAKNTPILFSEDLH